MNYDQYKLQDDLTGREKESQDPDEAYENFKELQRLKKESDDIRSKN